MKNKDLSSKVLVSLLTMSCVYLGGTSELPTVDAATTGIEVSVNDAVVNDNYDLTDNDSVIGIHVGNVSNITVNSSEVKVTSVTNAVGISVGGGEVTVSDGITVDAAVSGSVTTASNGQGVLNNSGTLSLGANTNIKVNGTTDNTASNKIEGITCYGTSTTSLGSGSLIATELLSGKAYALHYSVGFTSATGAGIDLGDAVILSAAVNNNKAADGRSVGIFNEDGAALSAGDNLIVKAAMESQTDGIRAKAEGLVNYTQAAGVKTVIGSGLQVSSEAKATTGNVSSAAVYNYDAAVEIGAGALITAKGEGRGQISVNGFVNYDNAAAELQDGTVIKAEGKRTGGTAVVQIQAIENSESSTMRFGDNITLSAVAEDEFNNGNTRVRGIANMDAAQIEFGDNVTVLASSANANDVRAVYNTSGSDIAFGDNTKISGQASADGLGVGVFNHAAMIDFAGSVYVEGSDYALYNANSGTIDAVAVGKQKVLYGDVYSESSAVTELLFDTADSLFYGAAGVNSGGEVNISLTDNAVWQMQGDSEVTRLNLADNGRIDLTQYADYQTLQTTAYTGNNGSISFKTDLASETDGDKITIGSTTAAGITYIQVQDVSLTNGLGEITGVKNLLLVTDNSTEKAAQFAGKNLNAGGLWDVTPTVENGLGVTLNDGTQGTEEEWYLTKIAKTVNNDTGVLLEASDNSYALWRNSNDTLRKRLGELRYRADKNDGDGIWARYTGGKFGSSGFDGSYNMYQLGYDKADNAKSTYGFAVESGTGHADYSLGSGKDKLWAGSLYGTWQGEHGNYTDVVAKIGQFDTDINSYGDYPDKASSKNHAYSLSVEYGKTIELSEAHGTFIEPQVQFIMGRLGSSSYTTDRGNNVYLGGVNSYIGRLGIVAGQKMSGGNDVYFKANLLHEFGGDRDIYMQAANGETLSDSRDYGDTWFEVGLGTNINLSKVSHFYGDIERSFGADIQKKWQINAGVRFEF
ncbi:autotransporter outer membrane beta-barrel domain-containing protein [Phascolarctobacterium sp.]